MSDAKSHPWAEALWWKPQKVFEEIIIEAL